MQARLTTALPRLHRSSIYNASRMASARVADQLGVALTRLTNVLREAVLPPGMNSAQARTLLALHDAGPQRVTDLARLDHLKQPTMSAVVSRMEGLGWVRQLEDKSDLRAVIVRTHSRRGTDRESIDRGANDRAAVLSRDAAGGRPRRRRSGAPRPAQDDAATGTMSSQVVALRPRTASGDCASRTSKVVRMNSSIGARSPISFARVAAPS